MKQQVSPPVVAAVLVVAVVALVGFGYRAIRAPGGSRSGQHPPGMPPTVAAEFQRRMGGVASPPNGATASPSAPPGGAPVPMAPH
jgi:hypothetical protein